MGGESGVPAIPHCRSLSLLGERSAGTLYAADSDRYGGAVTVIVYARPADDRVRQRFEAMVDTARRLGAHPNLVTIHASGHTDDDGRPYVVSDGHDRTTAAGVLATSGVLGVDSVLPIGVALAGALETAHRAGMVHGGVAPGLILLRADGQPVLTEVGLYEFARPQGASAHLARWIPYHAPPEVLEGTEVTPATDVYSLASVIYTLLVGQPPYAGTGVDDSTASLLLRILQMPVPPIDRSDVPPGLEEALRAALSHSPAKRPQHALELAWAMQDAQRTTGLPVTEPFVMDLGSGGAAAGAVGPAPGGVAGGPGPAAAAGGIAGGLALGSGALPAPGLPAGSAPAAPGAGAAAGTARKDWSFLTSQPPAPTAGAGGGGGPEERSASALGAPANGYAPGADEPLSPYGSDGPDHGAPGTFGGGPANGTTPPYADNGSTEPPGTGPDLGITGAYDPGTAPYGGSPTNGTTDLYGPDHGPDGGGPANGPSGAYGTSPANGPTEPLRPGPDLGTTGAYGSPANGPRGPYGASPTNGTVPPHADSPYGPGADHGAGPYGSSPTNGTTSPYADNGTALPLGGTGASVFGPTDNGTAYPHVGGPQDHVSPPFGGATPNGTSVFGAPGDGLLGQPTRDGVPNGPMPLGGTHLPGDGDAHAGTNGHGPAGVGAPQNGYGSGVAGSTDGAPLPRRDAGPGSFGGPTGQPPAGRDGPAGALPRRGEPSGGGDSPQVTTPWWATPPFGTTAVSSSPAPAAPADNGAPGPLSQVGPLAGRDPLGALGGSRPSPLDAPALHQPLPLDERPPIDTRKLGEAFDPGRSRLPNRPAVPQARQAPTAPAPAPSSPTRRRRGDQGDHPGGSGEQGPAGESGTAGTSRRSRRNEARSRSGPGNAPAETQGGRAPATTTASRTGTSLATGIGTGLPAGANDRATSALERARQARLERQQREQAGGTATVTETRPKAEPASEPAPGRQPIGATPDMVASRSGPPALPVIVLVVLVLVLGLGGAWLVITGEDGPEPASEADEAQDAGSTPPPAEGAPPGQAATTPNRASDLTATETEAGVQLDWEGPEGAAYLVRVLSPSEPPRPLGAGPATALLIPPDLVQPGGAYCFDVVAAPAEGEPPIAAPEDPSQVVFPTACIGGANAEAVIRP